MQSNRSQFVTTLHCYWTLINLFEWSTGWSTTSLESGGRIRSASSAFAETNSPPGIYRTVQFSPDKEITQKIHWFLMHDESLIMNWTEYIHLPWLWLCKFHRLPKLNTVNLIVQYSTLIISSRGKRILVLTRNVGRFNGKVEALQ